MIYPAAVTPFDEKGRIDFVGVAKLLAWFESAGCAGVVLAGTNGEGPSLSAVEKRDLILGAAPLAGSLELILGIATPSSDEAVWLCKQAFHAGGKSVLLMPPGYFREASEAGIEGWFRFVMDRSPVPVIVYNFPKRTGFTLTPELLCRLSTHEKFAGVKDSSGEESNLSSYRQAVPQTLYMGDETLLCRALKAGWNGSISGASNVIPQHLVLAAATGDDARFELMEPVLKAIRANPQPATHKALLHRWGILPRPDLRLPLEPPLSTAVDNLSKLVQDTLG